MLTVPNQKVIKIHKENCDSYAVISLESIKKAAISLRAGAFKLWVYFAKDPDGYEFNLSSKDVQENFGIKKWQYDNGIKELIEKGYLVKEKDNRYNFLESPGRKK